jgi:methionine-R-sulfoxide reductase
MKERLKNTIILFTLLCLLLGSEKDSLKYILTDIQYEVTQNCGTEPPFKNEYWNNKEDGIYIDIITGVPLFSSLHKYNSGTGWPSSYDLIDTSQIQYNSDFDLGYKRIEIKSLSSNGHLGHLFNDGPHPTGLRYCVNSASLEFIKYQDLDIRGYSDYKKFFNTVK